jgi:hypothetical protein
MLKIEVCTPNRTKLFGECNWVICSGLTGFHQHRIQKNPVRLSIISVP